MDRTTAPRDPAESGATSSLPLAAASQRLRRRPGRPRTGPGGDSRGDRPGAGLPEVSVLAAIWPHGAQAKLAFAPSNRPGITARRLYSRDQAAVYLGCSTDTIDRMVSRGQLERLRLPGSRLVRFDVIDLDRLIAASR